jgi:hypothetical protein
MPEPHMEELDDTECRRLLAERHLGRLAIPDFGGPMIFPVNYVLDQDLVVFRTDPGSKLDAATERESVAFVVDAVDEATRTGWSVVVRGTLPTSPTPPTWSGSTPCPCTPGPLGRSPGTCACGQSRSPAAASGSPTICPSPGGADRAAPGRAARRPAVPAGRSPPPRPVRATAYGELRGSAHCWTTR